MKREATACLLQALRTVLRHEVVEIVVKRPPRRPLEHELGHVRAKRLGRLHVACEVDGFGGDVGADAEADAKETLADLRMPRMPEMARRGSEATTASMYSVDSQMPFLER